MLTRDKPTQIRYFTLASAQGETRAQCALGKLIMDEQSLIQSEAPMARAIHWFEKAAKRGDQEAQYCLALAMDQFQALAFSQAQTSTAS
jgi:TPR repeat protein